MMNAELTLLSMGTAFAGNRFSATLTNNQALLERISKGVPGSNRSSETVLDPRALHRLLWLQRRLERLYHLEPAPAVSPYVRRQQGAAREEVLVRESPEFLELVVLLPEESLEAVRLAPSQAPLDAFLEAVEGVSHFVHLSNRARTELPTTLLELELQAEVDKFAILAGRLGSVNSVVREAANRSERSSLHQRLYEDVRFLHESETESGLRYRLANGLAARLWSRLLPLDSQPLVDRLRRFYRAGQAEKIRMAHAA